MTTVLVTLLAVVVAVLVVLVAGIVRGQAQIVATLNEMGSAQARDAPPGVAREIVGRAPDGADLRIAAAGGQRLTILLFLTSTCTSCDTFWHALATREHESLGDARLVVVTKGEDAELPARVRELAPPDVPVVMSTSAWQEFGVDVAPHLVGVDASGVVVAHGRAETWDAVVQAWVAANSR
jgi:hypothetical protein